MISDAAIVRAVNGPLCKTMFWPSVSHRLTLQKRQANLSIAFPGKLSNRIMGEPDDFRLLWLVIEDVEKLLVSTGKQVVSNHPSHCTADDGTHGYRERIQF